MGLGNQLEELVFTNIGATPCLLRGYPTIRAGNGRVLHPQHGGTYFGLLTPADLQPRGHVFLDLATSRAACNFLSAFAPARLSATPSR